MFFGQQIAKLFQRAPCVFSGVRSFDAMMKMDLNFAVAVRLQSGKYVQNWTLILFSWKKVRVSERSAVVIANCVACGSCQLAPRVKPHECFSSKSRFEMIGYEKNKMARIVRLGHAAKQLACAPEWIAQQPRQ